MHFEIYRAEAAGILPYCSPMVDPYQPAEEIEAAMPALLDALIERPPRVFALQTRGPLVAPITARLQVLRSLRAAGIPAYATLAPLPPCDPEALIDLVLDASDRDIIADPFHVRAVKKRGATTRDEALRISRARGFTEWHHPAFQTAVAERMRHRAVVAGRRFATGTEAFALLAKNAAEIPYDGNHNSQRNPRTLGN